MEAKKLIFNHIDSFIIRDVQKDQILFLQENNKSFKRILIGGGNMKSTICSTCVNDYQNQNSTKNYDVIVGQTTTQEQRDIFINNIEFQIENLKISSQNLKNQNNKMIFSQSVNWINANQLVVFDIMLGLKGSDHDIIQIFEDSILKLMDSIQVVLKKSKNVYLGFIIANQTVVMATSIYRFYISHPMDSNKQLRIQKIKKGLEDIQEKLLNSLKKFEESNMSTNYLEQCLKLIESFGLALPEQNFTPILNFASGFAQMVAFGGTRGWDDMIKGVKEGVSQLINNRIHKEQVDNFVMYVTLERIKYSILKIMIDENLDEVNQEAQIIQTLQTIGKTIEYSQNWCHKYYFVQMLGELVLYRPQIELKSLENKLNDRVFPYDLSVEQIWDILIKNNWITQFKLSEGSLDKIGFLNQNRYNLEIINTDLIKPKIKEQDKHNKSKKKNKTPLGNGENTAIKQEFIKNLNTILDEFDPIKSNLRSFMIKGNQQTFKGMLSYCFEGLDESQSMANILQQTIIDIFSGKDPIEVLEISIKQIIGFASDFFSQQFTILAKMTETQLRNLFVSSLKDYKEDISRYVYSNFVNFSTIINVNQNLTNFPVLIDKFQTQMTQFIDKILSYMEKIYDSIKIVQQVTNSFQDQEHIFNSINKFLSIKTKEESDELVQQLISQIQQMNNHLDRIRDKYNKEGTITQHFLNKYLQINDNIKNLYQKISLICTFFNLDAVYTKESKEIQKIRIIFKKIENLDENDPNFIKNQQKIKQIFQGDIIVDEQHNYLQEINKNIDQLKEQIDNKILVLKQNLIDQDEQNEQDQSEGEIFYYIKMINILLIQLIKSYNQLSNDFLNMKSALKESNCFTHAYQWIKTVDNNVKEYLQQKSNQNLSIDLIKLHIESQAEIIESLEIEEEFSNKFLNCCHEISDNFNDLITHINQIFQKLDQSKDQQKLMNPNSQELLMVSLVQYMESPINELKYFMNNQMNQVKEKLLEDIQSVFKEFSNSAFSQDIKSALSSLRSITSLIDVGGLISVLRDKYSDQNWRIRDRIAIILFDLNRIYGGDEGEQIFANTLIHMKAKDINPKVQLTLKNEEILIEMKSILQTNWKSQESEIKAYIQTHFQELDDQVKKMQENKSIDKEMIIKYYEKKESQLNQQLENIADIGSLAGISLEFLKDIKKQLLKLQQQVEEVKEQLKSVGQNVLLLKGKSVYQLFDERRIKMTEEELDKKFADVQINIRAFQYRNKTKQSEQSYEFMDQNFIDQQHDYKSKIENINFEEHNHQEQDDEIIVKDFQSEQKDKKSKKMKLESKIKTAQEQTPLAQKYAENKINQIQQEQAKVLDTNSDNLLQNILEIEHISKDILTTPIKSEDIKISPTKRISKQESQKIQDIKQLKPKYILNTFTNHHYNSLLIHGLPGSGKSRLCQEIEFYFWQYRKVQKRHIFHKIHNSPKLQEILKNFSVDEIYELMRSFNLINEDGHFSDYFIEIEGDLEDIKSANRIQKECWTEEDKNEEDEKYELTDIQTESANQYFKKKLSWILQNNDFLLVSAIYDLLDDQFQNKPFPIYAQLSQLKQPNKNLLKEILSTYPYNFADSQIQQIRELTSLGDFKIVFILDGYNEMRQELQGMNLFTTNDLEQLRPNSDHNFEYPKMIITCRTSYLYEDDEYAKQFQNIYQRKQRITYQADKRYMEYFIDDLNQLQIQQYFKAKFLASLKMICLNNFEKNFQFQNKTKQKTEETLERKQIEKEFNIFWKLIYQRVQDEQEFDKIYMRKEFIDFIVDNFQKKVDEKILLQLSKEELEKYRLQLTKVYTQKIYEKIVKKTNIDYLLNNVLMMNIFIEAMEKLMIKLNSKDEIKLRIKSSLQQEDLLKISNSLSIDGIINLIGKGEDSVISNFSFSFERDEMNEKINQSICKDYYIALNRELNQNLTIQICLAMYQQDITRYKLYDIFLSNYIKQQIKLLKESGKLLASQSVMLKDCKEFVKKLAAAFHQNNKIEVKLQDQSQLYSKKSVWDEFFNDSELPIRQQVRQCLPFVCSGNLFHFMHPSIKDFILAHDFFDKINGIQLDTQLIKSLQDYKDIKEQKKQGYLASSKFLNEKIAKSNNSLKSSLFLNIKTEDLEPSATNKSDSIKETAQFDQKALIDLVIQQTKETLKQEIQENFKNEVIDALKIEINELKKSITMNESQIRQDEDLEKNYTYLDKIINTPSELESFLQFYNKKCNKKCNINELKTQIEKIFHETQKITDQQLNKTPVLYNYKNKGIMEFLMDKMKVAEIPDPYNFLVSNLIELIQLGRLDKRFTNAAVNAIGLLIMKGQSFNHMNFSGLDLQGANLYGGQFYKCIFNNCNMEGTNLATSIFYKCRFFNTNLSNSIFYNCNMSKSKFEQKTRLNDIQLGRYLDIYYHDLIQENQKDPSSFLHMIVDPQDSNFLIVIHTWFAIRIGIVDEGTAKTIKKFDKQLSKCGIIKYKKKQNCYVVGIDNNVCLLDIISMQFIDQIQIPNIDKITCFQYNNLNEDVLVGGVNKSTQQKYVYICQFLKNNIGSTKILTDECDHIEMDPVKLLLICHYDNKNSKTSTFIQFNQNNYQQIGEKQNLTKIQKQKKYGDLKKMINMQKNRFLIHPNMINIFLSLIEVVKGISEIIVQKEEEIETKVHNDDGSYQIKKKKRTHTIDSIRTHIINSKTFGQAEQILVNPSHPKLIICAYQHGLIRRFQMQSTENQNYDLFKDQLQINQISNLLQVSNKDSEVITSYINDSYDGIVQLAKFKFQMDKDQQLQTFQIIQNHELKTRRKKVYSQNEANIKHSIIGIMNHKRLLQEFILIVFENKSEILKFVLNNNLNQINQQFNDSESIRFKLKDLTPTGKQFQNFSIHSEDHNIFCFSFNQNESSQAEIVIYNVLQQQLLCNVIYNQLGDAKTRLYFDSNSDFKKILAYNRYGEIIVFDDIQYEDNIQSETDNLLSSQRIKKIKIQKQSLQIKSIQQPHIQVQLNFQKRTKMNIIIGKHPQNSKILLTYDYLENSISQCNMETGQIQSNFIDQMNDQKYRQKERKEKHNGSQFHKKVIQDLLDFFSKNSIEELEQDLNEEQLMKQFDARIQLKVHDVFPIIFIIFMGQSHMIYYSLDKNSIIQIMYLPFYFDPSVKFNCVNYPKNPNIMLQTYSQSMKVIKYECNDEQQIDKVQTLYQKNLSGAVFLCEKAIFDDCIMRKETQNMLYQNGAKVLNYQN